MLKRLVGPLLVIAFSCSAHADPPRAPRPAAGLINEPMTLAPLSFRISGELNLTHAEISDGGMTLTGNGVGLALGGDIGIVPRLSTGAFLAFPISPFADFGTFAANLQYEAVPDTLNLRLDIGAQRQSVLLTSDLFGFDRVHQDGFLFGFGIPIRVRLHPKVAFTSGSTWARGFDSQPLLSLGSGSSQLAVYGTILTQDVFTLFTRSDQGQRVTSGAVHLPLGILFQPVPALAVAVRSGYRLVFAAIDDGKGNTHTTKVHYIPLAFDLVVTPAKWVDLGFTATIFGPVAADSSTQDANRHYGDLTKFDFWMALRH